MRFSFIIKHLSKVTFIIKHFIIETFNHEDVVSHFTFRATSLRKYLATAIQVMALPKYQTEWVAEHLGHSLAVHRKFYRQSLDSVEIAKISKLMYLADHGKMNQVKGMTLDSVDTFLSTEEVFSSVTTDDYKVSETVFIYSPYIYSFKYRFILSKI